MHARGPIFTPANTPKLLKVRKTSAGKRTENESVTGRGKKRGSGPRKVS